LVKVSGDGKALRALRDENDKDYKRGSSFKAKK
jgi:hypothetical protein